MSGSDLLESSVLRKQLPTLGRAFDAQAVQECLAHALCGTRSAITACELEQATYAPGLCCILRYRIQALDRNTGRSQVSLITGRVFGSEAECYRYRDDLLEPLVPLLAGREESNCFETTAAVLAPLRMAACVFPIDGELPSLITATDRDRMACILNEVLPGGISRIELADYGRQHRATLRYLSDQRTVYGKLTADSSGALAGPITAALREQARRGGDRSHIPEALAWVPDLRLSLLGAIPGRPNLERALKARLRGKPGPAEGVPIEEMIEVCARIAATVHATDLAPGPVRTLPDELGWLGSRIAEVRRLSPELGDRLASCLQQLSIWAAGQATGIGLCHGDFTIGQVLFEGRESGLVDFDSACQGEPALDLGQFLAYIRLAGMAAGPLADELGETFLRAYVAALDRPVDAGRLAGRVAVYKMVSLLRRAVRSWEKFKPGRVEIALTALEQELARLPRGAALPRH